MATDSTRIGLSPFLVECVPCPKRPLGKIGKLFWFSVHERLVCVGGRPEWKWDGGECPAVAALPRCGTHLQFGSCRWRSESFRSHLWDKDAHSSTSVLNFSLHKKNWLEVFLKFLVQYEHQNSTVWTMNFIRTTLPYYQLTNVKRESHTSPLSNYREEHDTSPSLGVGLKKIFSAF